MTQFLPPIRSRGIVTRVLASLACMVILIATASFVSLTSFNDLRKGLSDFTGNDLPKVVAGSKLNQISANLASFAPALLASKSRGNRQAVLLRLKDQVTWLNEILNELEKANHSSKDLQRFRQLKLTLVDNLNNVAELVRQRSLNSAASKAVLQKAPQLNKQLIELNKQLFASTQNMASTIPGWSGSFSAGLLLIPTAAATDHPLALQKVKTQFEDHLLEIENNSRALPVEDRERAEILLQQLKTLGLGGWGLKSEELGSLEPNEKGIIPLREQAFHLDNLVQGTVSQNKLVADRFVASASSLTRKLQQGILARSSELDRESQEQSALFLLMSLMSSVGAIMVFFYINRSVIQRLTNLSRTMIYHASGQRVAIVTSGNDEITDMTKAFQFFVDVIEKRESELQEANRTADEIRKRLEDAIENISEGFVLFDADSNLVMCNTNYQKLYGYQPAQVVPGTSFKALVTIDLENDLPFDRADYSARRLSQLSSSEQNAPFRLKDGRWLLIRDQPTREGMVGIHIDVTQEIAADKSLREARDIAERADRAKSRFLAAASHDLRQPLHAIGLFVATLLGRSPDKKIKPVIENIERSIDHMNDLFESILDYSQLEAGELQPELSAFDLSLLLMRLENDFAVLTQEKGLGLEIETPDLWVRCEPLMLDRILRNLLSNAIRYTPSGRVDLKVETIDETTVRLVVSDTGRGIPENKQQQIFQEFYRSGDNAEKGLGLGLAIARQMAQLLGTEISLTSAVGEGSRFSLEITRAIAERTGTIDQTAVSRGGISPGENLLQDQLIAVLDDDPQILKAMRGLLEKWGCRVITAADKASFVRELEATDNQPLAFFVDYQLDNSETGIEVLQGFLGHKREGEQTGQGIIVSGNTDPAIELRAKEAGYSFFPKPLRPAKLAAYLRHLARKKGI